MGHAFAMVTLERNTGIPRDRVVNTFHFRTPDAGVSNADAIDISDRLQRFYKTAAAPSANAVQSYLSNQLATAGHAVKIYNMADPIPRVPVLTANFTLTLAATEVFPAEVALVLSLRAQGGSGTVAARARGRVYLGPLNVSASSGTSGQAGGDARPSAAFMAAVADSGKRLADEGVVGKPVLSVFSEVDKTLGIDADGLRTVIQLRVNNAWDTQRRRGADPTVNVDRFAAL